MRVVDLRSSPTTSALEVSVQASSAAELLRLMGVIAGKDGSTDYDVGRDRIDALHARVPADLQDDITDLDRATGGTAFLVLSLLAADLPEPGGVSELLEALGADPAKGWRLLLSHEAQELVAGDDDLPMRVLAGEPDAMRFLRGCAAETICPDSITRLMAADPVAYGQRIAGVVERFDAAIWQDLDRESMEPIHRDVAYHRDRLAAGVDPSEVILDATNGYELSDDARVRRVVLLPSYWMRPWLVVGRLGQDTEVISTVVADEFLALPPEAPPPALIKLFKALSDESRLKLLRRMSSGPISLTEATDALDVAKATAHHHLSILRQSGMVAMRGSGRSTRYALREDPATAARDALATYVPPRL
ncbi:MAG: helix-turn-helix domain-containing protein [Intrasporangiaceae bacterium]|nr:helix-turn-helix domain-containing protein [Intrasporangiaceae bacterium]